MAEFLGTLQPVGRNDENDISSKAEATATDGLGNLRLVRKSSGSPYMSIVRYYQAGATIRQGAPLTHHPSLSVDPNVLYEASTSQAGFLAAGIAAANVSNTLYFSYAYVYGYCPGARVATALASGITLTIGATTAGVAYLGEASTASNNPSLTRMAFAMNQFANTDIATLSSIIITTMLG